MTGARHTRGEEDPGPGRAAALRAREAIERVLFGIPELPVDFDRPGLRDRLLKAIQCLYAVLDNPVVAAAHYEGLAEGAALAAEGAALLGRAADASAVKPLDLALQQLAAAEGALRAAAEGVARIQRARRAELIGGARRAGVPPPQPFRASVGAPRLHAFGRLPVLPHIFVEPAAPLPGPPSPAAPLPRPQTLEELRRLSEDTSSGALRARLLAGGDEPALPDPSPLPFVYEPAVEETEVLRRIARDCLEDIANLRNLRKPNAQESWLDQGPFEQRLLDGIDAFAALGGSVLPQVSLFHAESRAPDPERAFAAALTLGCIDGADTVGAAVMTLKQSAPEELSGWFEGFSLAPSPAVDTAMADLCTSSRPELVALALDVLHARGTTPDEVIPALLERTEPPVGWRVARALATALPRHAAIDHLERMSAADDDDLFLAAVESLLRRGHRDAVALLRRAVDSPTSPARLERALPLLCLVGRATDLERLLAAAKAAPTARLVRGIGRFGHLESVGALLGLLSQEDRDLAAAAAEALERITGAGMREVVEERWEIELPPDAAQAGGIPVPTREVERVVMDPERWSAWFRGRARRLDVSRKTRGGVPFMPLRIVDELEARATSPACRDEAALELALVTGVASLFSPQDWVSRQRRHLSELRTRVAALEVAAGAWSCGLARASDKPGAPTPADMPRAASSLGRSASGTPLPATASPRIEGHEGLMAPELGSTATRPIPAFVPTAALPFRPAEQGPKERLSPPGGAPEHAIASSEPADVASTLDPSPHLQNPFSPFRPAISPHVTSADDLDSDSSVGVTGTLSSFPARPGAALPFRPSPPPAEPPIPASARPAEEPASELSLTQYASLCAELAVFPRSTEAIFQRYALESPERRAVVDAAWKERLRRDSTEYNRWQELYRYYHDYWTKRGTPSG